MLDIWKQKVRLKLKEKSSSSLEEQIKKWLEEPKLMSTLGSLVVAFLEKEVEVDILLEEDSRPECLRQNGICFDYSHLEENFNKNSEFNKLSIEEKVFITNLHESFEEFSPKGVVEVCCDDFYDYILAFSCEETIFKNLKKLKVIVQENKRRENVFYDCGTAVNFCDIDFDLVSEIYNSLKK